MPRPAIRSLSKVQIGKEITRGTVVAATRRLSVRSATYRRMLETDEGDEELTGSLARVARAPVDTKAWTEFEVVLPIDFAQILGVLGMSVRGGVAPVAQTASGTANAAVTFTATTMTDTRLSEVVNRWVGATITVAAITGVVVSNTATTFTVASWTGGTPANGQAWALAAGQLWTFTPPVAGDPTPDTYTLEYEEDSPSGDVEGMRAPYAFGTGFSMEGGDGGLGEITAKLIARATADGAATAALAVPTLVRAPRLAWHASFDSSWATLGSNYVLGEVFGFGYEFSDHLRAEWYEDARADLSFTQYEIGAGRVADLTIDMINDPNAGGRASLEKAAKAARALRYVRMQVLGSGFNALNLDGAYYHAADSMAERGSDRNGNAIVRAHLLSALDPTANQDIRHSVQTATAVFP